MLSEKQNLDKPLFNSFAAELINDPFPHYDRLRAAEPVYWDSVRQAWILTAYEDVRSVLEDPTFEAIHLADTIAMFARKMKKDFGPLVTILEAILFFQSGELHKRNRRSLTQVLTRIPLSTLAPLINQFASTIAADVSRRVEFDAAREYADLIPSRIMTHILGLPASDIPVLLDLAVDFTRTFDTVPTFLYDELNSKAIAALEHLSRRVGEAVSEGNESGLTILYQEAPFEGDAKLIEAAALTFFVFAVGTETTASLIAACIDSLLRRPDLYEQARQAPAIAARIVAETARLEGPVQRVARVAPRDLMIGAQNIRKGDHIMLLLGAANRDPQRFAVPAKFDLDRESNGDVAFGAGNHFCLGTSLARLETRIALEHFLQLPRFERCGPVTRYQNKSIRKLTSLPVRTVHSSSAAHAN